MIYTIDNKENKSKEYIHYGTTNFDPKRVDAINSNGYFAPDSKPLRVLWASPVDAEFGWKDFDYAADKCDENNSLTFSLKEGSNILYIYSPEDLDQLPTEFFREAKFFRRKVFDFEAMKRNGIDAVEYKIGGLSVFTPSVVSGWDVDSIVILNPNIVIPKNQDIKEVLFKTKDQFKYSICDGEVTILSCDDSDTKELIIPNNIDGYPVTEIASFAFYNCNTFESLIVPETVKKLDFQYLHFRGTIKSIELPDELEHLMPTISIKNICYPEDLNSTLCSEKLGVDLYITNIYIKGKEGRYESDSSKRHFIANDYECIQTDDGVVLCKNNKKDENAIIPSTIMRNGINYSVTEIGKGAFYEHDSLTSIIIPDSVTCLGKSAFYGCKKLTSVIIPDSVTEIDDRAFGWCESLTSVSISNSATKIGKEAFEGCKSLTSITIPDSVTEIGDRAFARCNSLTKIQLPKSWESKGKEALEVIGLNLSNPNLKITYGDQGQGQNENVGLGNIQVDKPVIGACDLDGQRKETPVKSRK